MAKHINIPIFIPHEGCPNDCVFCNQRTITGQCQKAKRDIKKEIDEALSTYTGDAENAEIAFFGKAALLIPYPAAAENHQYDNANFLAATGGAIILDNSRCTPEKFKEIITPLLNSPQKLAEMGAKTKTAHTHDAIYEILQELNKQKSDNK